MGGRRAKAGALLDRQIISRILQQILTDAPPGAFPLIVQGEEMSGTFALDGGGRFSNLRSNRKEGRKRRHKHSKERKGRRQYRGLGSRRLWKEGEGESRKSEGGGRNYISADASPSPSRKIELEGKGIKCDFPFSLLKHSLPSRAAISQMSLLAFVSFQDVLCSVGLSWGREH